MPSYLRKRWKLTPLGKYCRYERKLAVLQNQSVLVPILAENQTCWMQVTRGRKDSEFKLSKCTPLNSAYKLKDEDAIIVRSGDHFNLFAHFPTTKPRVQEKFQHWATKYQNKLPISVFILGVDSSSRAQVYRSLPKTLALFERLNFVDFKAFHSLAPNSLTNFMASLMGLRRGFVRQTCTPNWKTPYDSYPFIWKNFSDENYVTMYMENEPKTFNWGGQSGFRAQPTDYYWGHSLDALWKFRNWQIKKLGLKNNMYVSDCAADETLAQFMLQTSRQFVHKFAHVPFFHLSWINEPFHQNLFALPAYDDPIRELFESFESQPELLHRTLIIFLSDHGDRFGFYNSRSLESFIERGHTPLFIRVPEMLLQRHPDIMKNVVSNAQKFVTPFDIHQTLLDVLAFDSGRTVPWPPPSHPRDERASLFSNIPRNRTCRDSGISVMRCLCNILYHEEDAQTRTSFDSNKELQKVFLKFAAKQLNLKMLRSNYSKVCEEWTVKESEFKYIRKIGQTKQVLEFLVAFTAQPGEVSFEIRLKFYLDQNSLRDGVSVEKSLEFVGIQRASKYGNQSWCVGKATDEDKIMKEFCYCKEQKRKHET